MNDFERRRNALGPGLRLNGPQSVYVYLLHFHQPIAPGRHTCQHYMGSAEDLQERLSQHRTGVGAKLCKVAIERGIDWEIAMVWQPGPGEDGRLLEKKLKARHNGKALCPICAQGGERVIGEDVNFYTSVLGMFDRGQS